MLRSKRQLWDLVVLGWLIALVCGCATTYTNSDVRITSTTVKSRLEVCWDIHNVCGWDVEITRFGRDKEYRCLSWQEFNAIQFRHHPILATENYDCDEAAYESFVSAFVYHAGTKSNAIFPAGTKIARGIYHAVIIAVLDDDSVAVYDPRDDSKMLWNEALSQNRYQQLNNVEGL